MALALPEVARYYRRETARLTIGPRVGNKAKGGLQMEGLLLLVGRLAALGGVLLCAWAVYSRFSGTFFTAGFQTGTMLLGGMALMLAASICFLLVLTGRPRR